MVRISKNNKYQELSQFTHRIKTTYLKGVNPDGFIKILQKEQINIVVDIRDWSIFPLYFYPKNLKELLRTHNIEYLRYKILGNPSELRKRAGKDFELAKKLYLQEHIFKNLKSQESLGKLFRIISNSTRIYCLICYCPTLDINLCHRFWLKELLINLKRKSLGLSGDYIIENYPNQKQNVEVIS